MVHHKHVHRTIMQAGEQVHEARGISAARHHCEDARPGGQQPMAAAVLVDAFVDAHAGSMHVASDQPRATSGAVSRARSELVTGPGHVAASRPSRSSTTVVGRPLTA